MSGDIFVINENPSLGACKVYIAYRNARDELTNILIQAHEESHAVDSFCRRRVMVDEINKMFPLLPTLKIPPYLWGAETFANAGTVYALRKRGLSFSEVAKFYDSLLGGESIDFINSVFQTRG